MGSTPTPTPTPTADGVDNGQEEIQTLTLIASAFNSIAAEIREKKAYTHPFDISPTALGALSKDRSRAAFIELLQSYINTCDATVSTDNASNDAEDPGEMKKARAYIESIIAALVKDEKIENPSTAQEQRMNHNLEVATTALTTVILRSSPDQGITTDETDLRYRLETFGSNAIADKKMKSFLFLCWKAVQDFVLIMLIVMGVVSIVVELTIGRKDGAACGSCWLEGFAILMSVCIVVLVTATIDYMKQFAFKRLSKNLQARNTKSVIRNGEQVVVTDADIVVGDILSVNSHSSASIPADCVLLGPGMDLKMDESSLTGESHTLKKVPGDVILSGTNAVQGSGKMVVIAVGINSVAGKIKAHVYESGDASGDMEGDSETPLYTKLDKIAKQIGIAGTIAAVFAFVISCAIGLGYHNEEWEAIIDYFIVSVTVLAVAVPEGLPLAVVLSLAFSSNKMMGENNMVKSLDACETMGCATTICTDKTGECIELHVCCHV